MRILLIVLLMLPLTLVDAQKIGKLAPEKKPTEFPTNAWGGDIMFSEGGFGLGTFLRHQLTFNTTWFIDFSISELKDNREIEFINIYGQKISPGKKNRVFSLPVLTGLQYRLFSSSLTDQLRPYVNIGVGPNFVVSTPYSKEFFDAFGKARLKLAATGYIGFGANFGISQSNLLGVNVRYYLVHFFDEGVENLNDSFRKDIGSFYLTINLGIMY